MSEPSQHLPSIEFEDLPPMFRQAAERAGWSKLMPVQSKSIPYIMQGVDVMVQSRTGSGKTGAFLLPLLELLDPNEPTSQAIIMVPTRELARQVSRTADILCEGTGLRTVSVYGGVGYGPQLEALRAGAHLVIGTPGRILDHLERRSMNLDSLRVLIFDEADRMLSVGFYPDMKALQRYLPEPRRSLMFSATYPPSVVSLAKEFLSEPEILNLSHGQEHVAETAHVAYEVPAMKKTRCLVRIIEMENPDSAIIFVNTKATGKLVATVLSRFGYDAGRLDSDLSQVVREEVLEKVYEHKLRFLVATDVAARGIDITGLSHVVLYDFPEDPESYIHRTGRTGRAGASGEAISLVDSLEHLRLKSVARKYDIEIETRETPTDEDVAALVSERITALLEAELRGLDRLVIERMQRMLPLAQRLAEDEDERAVMAMLLDQYYQRSLHDSPATPAASVAPKRERSEKPEPRRRGRPARGRRPQRRR